MEKVKQFIVNNPEVLQQLKKELNIICTKRVRQIIPHMDFAKLQKQNIIPPTAFTKVANVKYQPWVYQKRCFSFHGIYMESLIKKMISDKMKVKFGTLNIEDEILQHLEHQPSNQITKYIDFVFNYKSQKTPWTKMVTQILKYCQIKDNPFTFTDKDLPKLPMKTYYRLANALTNQLQKLQFTDIDFDNVFDITKTINHNNQDYPVQILGHPDITTRESVLDVKTSACFENMREESILQILCYFTMYKYLLLHSSSKQKYEDLKYAGLVLPMTQQIITINLSKWDWEPFLNVMTSTALLIDNPFLLKQANFESNVNQESNANFKSNANQESNANFKSNANQESKANQSVKRRANAEEKNLGVHVPKVNNSIYQSLCIENLPQEVPLQMFLRPNRNGNEPKYDDMDIARAIQHIYTKKIRYYTHASYLTNLSRPYLKNPKTNKFDDWALEIVRKDLKLTQTLGGYGVVIHVGKSLKMSISSALNKMYDSIMKIYPATSVQCPLLIETPAGQGTELCVKFEEFSKFYQRFSTAEKQRIRICIDTCHVFAAGYEPDEYIESWIVEHGEQSIGLIHFNDSKEKKNSRKDRHAPIGQGHINIERLQNVINLAYTYNIDLVRE